MVCFRFIIVNTLHKGDNRDAAAADDDDNNSGANDNHSNAVLVYVLN